MPWDQKMAPPREDSTLSTADSLFPLESVILPPTASKEVAMDIGHIIEGRASSQIISCSVDTPVREAVALLAARRIGALPIMEAGKVAGIFSERDVIYRLAEEGDACLERPVGEIMTSPAITVERSTDLIEALSLMTRRRIRHLPVVEGETMCGFISIGDLVKTRLDQIENEAEAMRTYIQTA